MIEFTKNSCLEFGYDGIPFSPKIPGSKLFYEMKRCTREPGSFKEECINVAQLMAAKAKMLGREIYVMLSGGLDSEVVARSFIDAGIPFKVLTWRFSMGLNAHETFYAEIFARKHGLNIEYLLIDPLQFLQTEAKQLFMESCCSYAVMTFHMKAMSHIWDNLHGMPVLGGFPPQLTNFTGDWKFEQFEFVLSWYWHTLHHDIDTGLAFYQYTPEILLAFMDEPRIRKIAVEGDVAADRLLTNSIMVKYDIYRDHWVDLTRRPKFTGGESIYPQLHALEKGAALERPLDYRETWVQPYSELISQLIPLG